MTRYTRYQGLILGFILILGGFTICGLSSLALMMTMLDRETMLTSSVMSFAFAFVVFGAGVVIFCECYRACSHEERRTVTEVAVCGVIGALGLVFVLALVLIPDMNSGGRWLCMACATAFFVFAALRLRKRLHKRDEEESVA
ncbi:MAG: hypothetical protein V4480_04260 [Patescibacteria group bacterium]